MSRTPSVPGSPTRCEQSPFTVDNLLKAPHTPFESLITLLAEHFKRLYPAISVLGEASYARFEDNVTVSVVEAPPVALLDRPKRYRAATLWSAAADYSCFTVLLEGPPGVGKSTVLRLIAREQWSCLTSDDEVRIICGDATTSRHSCDDAPSQCSRTVSLSAYASPIPSSRSVATKRTNSSLLCHQSVLLPSSADESFRVRSNSATHVVPAERRRLVVLVELKHLALQTVTHGWEKITPQRLLDVALRGLGGGSRGGIAAIETLGGLKAALLVWPIIWLLDGFDEVCNVACPALQSFFHNFVFPSDDTGGGRPKHASAGLSHDDVVIVTCREDHAALSHPVMAGRRPCQVLRMTIKRWSTAETLSFVDSYFAAFRASHPELTQEPGQPAYEDVVLSVLQEPNLNAWNGVPLMCDILCFMAVSDVLRLSTVTSPVEALHFALEALFQRNVPVALQQVPVQSRDDAGGTLRKAVFQTARDRALRVFETGSNAITLDLSTFNGCPVNNVEFALSYTGWLLRRSDVADGAGTGNRHSSWYFSHRCFLEFLAATSLSCAEPKVLHAWLKDHLQLHPGQRMMLTLLCHEAGCKNLTKHRELIISHIHKQFISNYERLRDRVRLELQQDPPFRTREQLWEATGALIAVEASSILHDDRIVQQPKHLGIVPHMKNPSYFYLLLEPIARLGNLHLLKQACAALEADGRLSDRLASQALAQAVSHAPHGALMSFAVDGGGHRMVIDYLISCGGTIQLSHACECCSVSAVAKALQSPLAAEDFIRALETAVDHGFDAGVSLIVGHCDRTVSAGFASTRLLGMTLSAALGRSLVLGQLRCFHAAAGLLVSRQYELVITHSPRHQVTTTAVALFDESAHRSIVIEMVLKGLPHTFSDKHLSLLLSACPRAESLDCSGLTGIVSDDGLISIAENCRDLVVLNVASARGAITERGLLAIFTRVTSLEYVNISGIGSAVTDRVLVALANTCGLRLRHLDISRNRSQALTDNGVASLLRHCAVLRSVSLADTALSDVAVHAIARASPLLQTLDAGGNGGSVTDGALHVLAQYCKELVSVDVSEACGRVTNAAILSLAANCRRLKCLNISGSRGAITDEAFMALARYCPELESLDAAGALITNAALCRLAHGCRQLRNIRISASGAITDTGLKEIATGCTHLESLHVDGVSHQITKAGAKAVATRCSNLSSLYIGGVTTR